MKKTWNPIRQGVDYNILCGKEMILVEVMTASDAGIRRLQAIQTYYVEKLCRTVREKMEPAEKPADDYRVIGKYRVKETFAGEESLTSLLTQYVERSIALRY